MGLDFTVKMNATATKISIFKRTIWYFRKHILATDINPISGSGQAIKQAKEPTNERQR
jgi:hypothetical protein